MLRPIQVGIDGLAVTSTIPNVSRGVLVLALALALTQAYLGVGSNSNLENEDSSFDASCSMSAAWAELRLVIVTGKGLATVWWLSFWSSMGPV